MTNSIQEKSGRVSTSEGPDMRCVNLERNGSGYLATFYNLTEDEGQKSFASLNEALVFLFRHGYRLPFPPGHYRRPPGKPRISIRG